ncbi:MAG: electron transfer flavoprotein subunit beta/FixA family protein [Deltaproteobacteria bacterium]|nr:electron transfer flavoprotein subunit beta/FixA family protein [Deltaproteobacteria bacterium]
MDIIVCIKQVPDTETQIKIDSAGTDVVKDDIKWIMNPYDEFGVEEALRLKEKHGGSVTVVSVGPKRATEAIRTALAMGADKGMLLNDQAFENGDSFSAAKALAAAIKTLPHSVIFCGQRAIDDDNATAGAALAHYLGIPQVCVVTKVEVASDGASLTATRPVEGGNLLIRAQLPCVLTTQKGLNEPRYASLPGIMKAKKKPLEEKSAGDLGLDPSTVGAAGSKTRIRKLTPPPTRKAGQIVQGETVEEKSAKLVKLLHDEAKVV